MALSNKLVSIILPTRNSEVVVPKLIKGIKAQTYHEIECINIDNFSKDNTVDLLKDTAITYQKGLKKVCKKIMELRLQKVNIYYS